MERSRDNRDECTDRSYTFTMFNSTQGILKGKLAIKLFKSYPHLKQKPYWGNHFWSRGYFVTTVGVDEEVIKRYVKYQEGEDKKEESQTRNFDLFSPPSET